MHGNKAAVALTALRASCWPSLPRSRRRCGAPSAGRLPDERGQRQGVVRLAEPARGISEDWRPDISGVSFPVAALETGGADTSIGGTGNDNPVVGHTL